MPRCRPTNRSNIFIDESGDPGIELGATDQFYLAALHVPSEEVLRAIRAHLVNLRYHHSLGGGELKDWWPIRKGDGADRYLNCCTRLFQKLSEHGEVKGTAVWIDKANFTSSGGTVGSGVDAFKFRNYVLNVS